MSTTAFSYDSLSSQIRTVEDLHLVSGYIDTLLTSLFSSSPEEFPKTLRRKLPSELAEAIIASLEAEERASLTHERLQTYFTGLKEYMRQLPLIQLTLAYRPSPEQIGQISDKARELSNRPVILQLSYNTQIIGGLTITYAGNYRDLSLRTKLDKVYEERKADLFALIERQK